MSSSNWSGRKVKDPQLNYRPTSSQYTSELADIDSAWETLQRTKSILRSADHHLEAAAASPHISTGGTTNGADAMKTGIRSGDAFDMSAVNMERNVPVDKVPSYTVDKLRSHRQPSKTAVRFDDDGCARYPVHSRKVSRIEDKYPEVPAQDKPVSLSSRQRSPLRDSKTRTSSGKPVSDRRAPVRGSSSSDFRDLPSKFSSSSGLASTAPHSIMKPSRQHPKSQSNPSSHPISSQRYGAWVDATNAPGTNRNTKELSLNETDETDVNALRTTEVNYLNNTDALPNRTTATKSILDQPPARWTHVNVNVPGVASSTVPSDSTTAHHSTFTKKEKQKKQIKYALRKNKDLVKNDEGFSKFKELIDHQKELNNSRDRSDTSLTDAVPPVPSRHGEKDVVIPADEVHPPVTCPRKVAAGPPGPHYKGFSETETRYQTTDGKVVKLSELKKSKHDMKRIKRWDVSGEAKVTVDRTKGPSRDKDDTKDVKSSRVVSKKPKHRQSADIITPSSWRIDQQLAKSYMPAVTNSPPTKDKPTLRDTTQSMKQNIASHVLSDQAKNVLQDLQLSDGEHDADHGPRSKSDRRTSPRRKRRTEPLPDRDEKILRVRHYKQTEAQEYMQRKRQQRLKQEQEQKLAHQQREAKKQQNLANLMKNARKHISVAQQKGDIKADNKRDMGSDKENHLHSSCSSQTSEVPSSIEDSENESFTTSGQSTYTKNVFPAENSAGASAKQDDLHPRVAGAPQLTKSDTKDSGLHTLTADEIMQKYGKQIEEIREKNACGKHPLSSVAYTQKPTVAPEQSEGRTRTDRKLAIQQMGMSLLNRINDRTKVITKNPTVDRWAFPRENSQPVRSEEFVSRYDAMTKPSKDYPVFDGKLPGTEDTHKQALELAVSQQYNEAAIKIQSAYRGHTVRQAMTPERHGKEALHHSFQDYGDLSITDDDSLSESYNLPGKAKKSAVYEAVSLVVNMKHKPTPALRNTHTHVDTTTHTHSDLWPEQRNNPYSTMNVYYRKLKQGEIQMKLPDESDDTGTESDVSYENDFTHTHTQQPTHTHMSAGSSTHSDTHAHTEKSSTLTSRSKSDSLKHTSDALRSESLKHATESLKLDLESLTSDPLRHSSGSQRQSHSSADIDAMLERANQRKAMRERSLKSSLEGRTSPKEVDDDTLDETLTPSLDSDGSLLNNGLSDVSTLSDSTDVSKHASALVSVSEPRQAPSKHRMSDGRLSPGALERRMTAELNLWHGMDVSISQVSNVEKSRAVTMAQQESVSMAQILKARQQAHEQEIKALGHRAKQEALETSRQIEESRRKATDATHNAAQVISQVRQGHDVSSLQESTQKLIETQAQAAEATAQAAKQLAEVKLSTGLFSQQAHKQNLETVSTAAAAAVLATMQQNRGVNYTRGAAIDEKSTQYSLQTDLSQRSAGRSSQKIGAQTDPTSTNYSSTNYSSDSYDSTSQSITHGSRSQDNTSPSATRGSRSNATSLTPTYTTSTDTRTTAKTYKSRDSSSSSIHTDKDSPSTASIVSAGSIQTASDLSSKTSSTIRTASDMSEHPSNTIHTATEVTSHSQQNSITEEVNSTKDSISYSQDFDTSYDDFDRSIRDVVPSEGDIKRVRRKSTQSELDYTSDMDVSMSSTSSRRMSFESDSFSKFTCDMVKQFMREKEMRDQHQTTMLKLRKQAIKEKTKAELAWLEQQKKLRRNKGADDTFPREKKRKVLLRLHKEQGEIKKLEEAQRVASNERKLLIQQSEDIAKIKQNTQQIHAKMQRYQVREKMRTRVLDDTATTEDDISIQLDDDSEMSQLSSPRKDADDSRALASPDVKVLHKLKRLDKKYMTVREQKLQERRRCAEELLAWNRKLDEEEAMVVQLEQQAMATVRKDKPGKSGKAGKPPIDPSSLSKSIADKSTVSSTRDRTTRATDGRTSSSIAESYSMDATGMSSSKTTASRSANDSTRTTSTATTLREESIAEDISTDSKRTQDSSDDTIVTSTAQVTEEYTTENFESDVTASQTTATAPAATGPAAVVPASPTKKNYGSSAHSPQKVPAKIPAKTPSPKRCESESEDSFSVTHSEGASDLSDIEGRVNTLNEELRRRKLEVERLKKAKKKKKHEKMREQELALKKQIEAYDSIINQAQDDLHQKESSRSPTKPVIKSPQKPSPPVTTSSPHTSQQTASISEKDDVSEAISESIHQSQSSKSSSSKAYTDSYTPVISTQPISASSVASADHSRTSNVTSKPIPESISRMSPSVIGTESHVAPPSAVEPRPLVAPPGDTTTHEVDTLTESSGTIDEDVIDEDVASEEDQESDGDDQKLNLTLATSPVQEEKRVDEKQDKDPSESREVPDGPDSDESIHTDSSVHSESTYTHTDSTHTRTPDTRTDTYTSVDSTSNSTSKQATNQYTEDFSTSQSASSSRTTSPPPELPSQPPPPLPHTTASHSSHSTSSMIHTDEEVSIIEDQSDASDQAFRLADSQSEVSKPTVDQSKPDIVADITECEDLLSAFSVGQRVLVGGVQPGTLRFKGRTSFAPGFWGGIELDTNEGYNNGSKDGVNYFNCAEKRGIFAPPEKISALSSRRDSDVHESIDESLSSDISEHTLTEVDDVHPQADDITDLLDTVMKPADSKENQQEKPENEQMDQKVDAITDSLTKSVLQEAVDVMSNISDTKDKHADDIPAKPARDDVKEQTVPESKEDEVAPKGTEVKAVESTTSALLTDAISHMMKIRKKKQESLDNQSNQQVTDLVTNERNLEKDIERHADDSRSIMPGSITSGKSSSYVTDEKNNELSKNQAALSKDLDDLYADFDLGNDDWMMDDDFGLGNKKPSTPQNTLSDLKLDLTQVTAEVTTEPEVFCVVPRSTEQINELVDKVIELFWEKRRYGESWENMIPPPSYYISPRMSGRSDDSKKSDRSNENTNSSDVYKRMVFAMTTELLTDMYRSELDDDRAHEHHRSALTPHTMKHPPTTVDTLKPMVQKQMNKLLRTNDNDMRSSVKQKPNKWSSRKRKDNVDLLLVDELKSEEPDWVNYDVDELTVKTQLADAIFDSLLIETGQVCMDIYNAKLED